MRVDLHVHTTLSDGRLTPEQVVEKAAEKRLSAIAITDHDTISGIELAEKAAVKKGIEVIPGVELSTLWHNVEIHMLGYWIDHKQPAFLKLLQKQRKTRTIRNQLMIEKLRELGMPITIDEVLARKKESNEDQNVGRPHIAEVMIEKGWVSSLDEAFERYLGKNGAAYVTPERISPTQAIAMIRNQGGVPVLAHPGLYHRDEWIESWVGAGLIGIEVNHPDHSEEDRRRYVAISEKYQLIQTAGSDFHGDRNGVMHHADLGTCTITMKQVENLKKSIKKAKK